MTSQTDSDKVIEQLGGCGRFQLMINTICHSMKMLLAFSFATLIVASFTPSWWCDDDAESGRNISCGESENNTQVARCGMEACSINGTQCSNFGFGGTMRTMVSEFGLVCGRDYIPSMVMSIQLAGMLVGNVSAGHIAEYIGRKKPLFAALVLISVANLIGYFSVNWIMFATTRLFIGFAGGCFMTSKYSLLCEFSSSKWRVWIIGIPSWPIHSCIFALFAWLIQDWRYIQLMTGLLGIPFLLTWFIIPESFRWYIAHDKIDEAKTIVKKVAAMNKKELHDLDQLMVQPIEVTPEKKYTFLDLFKTKTLIRISLLSSLNWLGLGLVSYGILFAVQSLSGNIFFNIFLFNAVGIPSKISDIWLQNKIGRRKSAMLCFTVVAIGSYAVGIVQSMDAPNKDSLTNGFALFAFIGINTAWGPVQTMTIELYPTVIRPIGFGTLSVVGRIGAVIGPQLAYLNLRAPGVMYYVLGVVATCCVIGSFGLPETKGASLNDKINRTTNNITPQTETMIHNSDTISRAKNNVV